jgi:hypothetical protein
MRVSFRLFIAAFLLLAATIVAADKPDFSGLYTRKESKESSKASNGGVGTLRVVQTGNSLEVTDAWNGKQTVNEYRMDGSRGPYTSQSGVAGTCTAKFKGKTLILDIDVTAQAQPSSPAVQMHTRQRWELSPDMKILTIHNDVDFPNVPLNGFQVIPPWTDVYTRD